MTKQSDPYAISYSRWSTPDQAAGDSLRRQRDPARQWCKKNGVELREELVDDGLSAYTGKNRECGQFGSFLRAVQDGKIPRGTYLLVEHLDRMSRQDVETALGQLLLLMSQGIRIVTLADNGRVYETGQDFTNLIIAVVQMAKGHSESEDKSRRIREGMERARREGTRSGRPIGRAPGQSPKMTPKQRKAWRRSISEGMRTAKEKRA